MGWGECPTAKGGGENGKIMRLQRHKKTSGKEAQQLTVAREGGCRGDNAACAPGRFDGHEGGRSHVWAALQQGLEHRHTLSMHAHGRVACRRATGLVAERGGERGDEAEPVRRGRVDGQKTRRHYRARVSSSLANIALQHLRALCPNHDSPARAHMNIPVRRLNQHFTK